MSPERYGPGALAGAAEAKGKITSPKFNSGTGLEQATARCVDRRKLSRDSRQGRQIDFVQVNRAALAVLPRLLQQWLPGGRIEGSEYVALNPRRADHRPGSFKVNLHTGRWADFAIGAKGGDPISLAAYLAGCGQLDAARQLAAMLGLSAGDHVRR